MKFADLFKKFKGGEMSRAEISALRISILIAALDGDVSCEELKSFEQLAQSCAGYTKEDADKAFNATLRSAGYLMLLAKVVTREMLLEAFVIEADAILPIFADLGPDAIKRAAEIWRSMANADGDFSEIERLAIDKLEELLKLRYQVMLQTVTMGALGDQNFSL